MFTIEPIHPSVRDKLRNAFLVSLICRTYFSFDTCHLRNKTAHRRYNTYVETVFNVAAVSCWPTHAHFLPKNWPWVFFMIFCHCQIDSTTSLKMVQYDILCIQWTWIAEMSHQSSTIRSALSVYKAFCTSFMDYRPTFLCQRWLRWWNSSHLRVNVKFFCPRLLKNCVFLDKQDKLAKTLLGDLCQLVKKAEGLSVKNGYEQTNLVRVKC